MDFALSTRWNVRRHTRGEDLVDEILAAGFREVELGYDLTLDLVEGVRRRVADGAVRVVSVHNFCPVPLGVPRGHPELYTFADPDVQMRRFAARHTTETVRFAAGLGCRRVVVHAGYVGIRPLTPKLHALIAAGRQFTPKYERLRQKLDLRRERRAARALDWVAAGLEEMMPVLEETGATLALENLPTWEAVPNESEMVELARRFGGGRVGYWHDLGHGQIRENLGFGSQERQLERLSECLAGFHVHDLVGPAQDHVLPFEGEIDFARFARFAARPLPRVIEPGRDATAEQLRGAAARLAALWSGAAAAAAAPPAPAGPREEKR